MVRASWPPRRPHFRANFPEHERGARLSVSLGGVDSWVLSWLPVTGALSSVCAGARGTVSVFAELGGKQSDFPLEKLKMPPVHVPRAPPVRCPL